MRFTDAILSCPTVGQVLAKIRFKVAQCVIRETWMNAINTSVRIYELDRVERQSIVSRAANERA